MAERKSSDPIDPKDLPGIIHAARVWVARTDTDWPPYAPLVAADRFARAVVTLADGVVDGITAVADGYVDCDRCRCRHRIGACPRAVLVRHDPGHDDF